VDALAGLSSATTQLCGIIGTTPLCGIIGARISDTVAKRAMLGECLVQVIRPTVEAPSGDARQS
jgi:hypothetical protein